MEESSLNPSSDDGLDKKQHLTKRLKASNRSSSDSILGGVFNFIEVIVSDSRNTNPKVFRVPIEPLNGRNMNIRAAKELSADQPSVYVPSRFHSAHQLADVWDGVVLTSHEELALNALRIIEPDIISLAFVNKDQPHRRPDLRRNEAEERVAMLKIKNKVKRTPLLSMGDGMSRVLQLILSASQAKDGFLLVDEIENGLHYSVQEKVWGMLFELAEKNNIQIFATTHSEDCVKTFAKVSTERQNVKGCLIRLGRSPDGETEAAVLNEDQVQNLIQAEIEVR